MSITFVYVYNICAWWFWTSVHMKQSVANKQMWLEQMLCNICVCHICVCVYNICLCICKYGCIIVSVYVCMCECMKLWMHACVYSFMCVCVCVFWIFSMCMYCILLYIVYVCVLTFRIYSMSMHCILYVCVFLDLFYMYVLYIVNCICVCFWICSICIYCIHQVNGQSAMCCEGEKRKGTIDQGQSIHFGLLQAPPSSTKKIKLQKVLFFWLRQFLFSIWKTVWGSLSIYILVFFSLSS